MCHYQPVKNPLWTRNWSLIGGEAGQPVTICHQFKLRAADGKMRMSDVADQEQIFRIIQSVPSPKAEPFKQWMAMVAWEISCDFLRNPKKCSNFAGGKENLFYDYGSFCVPTFSHVKSA